MINIEDIDNEDYTSHYESPQNQPEGQPVEDDFIQDYEIIISPRCKNFLLEINNYVWQDSKTGEKINKPIDEYNHLMDAMRYSVEDFIRGRKISFFS